MSQLRSFFSCYLVIAIIVGTAHSIDGQGTLARKPLYRDPIYNGAADPVVVWNPKRSSWWMFYTNRRANVPGLSGVAWVHGSPIGIAESRDGGGSWKYIGTAEIMLPAAFGKNSATFWAPDVIRGDDGKWHMFLTVVPGIFEDWQHPRDIVQLESRDLRKWKYLQKLKLSSDRVIDPSIMKLPGVGWRLWYNNERDKKSIYYADSPDMKTWTDHGKAVGDKPGEGPKVFRWKNKFWLIDDQWKGLGVYRSDDAKNWEPQNSNLVSTPGKGEDDQVIGQHPDVVVSGDRAFLFYFTHPGRWPEDPVKTEAETRRSSIQVCELKMREGWLTCDRDAQTYIDLRPPQP